MFIVLFGECENLSETLYDEIFIIYFLNKLPMLQCTSALGRKEYIIQYQSSYNIIFIPFSKGIFMISSTN